ncbi:MAG: signal peptide peptidase SppA, partial [Bacteroidetes bacterium]|nr:signal peptide peptidase SppA [Bacteroidota bacterium]
MRSFFKIVLATMLGMFLTGILLFVMVLIVAGVAFSGMKKEVEVPDKAVLEFRLPMSFSERSPFNPLELFDESG